LLFSKLELIRYLELRAQVAVLLLVALPAVLAKVGEEGSGKRVPKQIHTKGEYHELTSKYFVSRDIFEITTRTNKEISFLLVFVAW
jgi:hypothetical protein